MLKADERIKQPKLNLKVLKMSEHAYERAKERFNCKDKQHALNYFKSLLGDAEYIGITCSDEGSEGHTYLKNRIGIIISTDLTNIITAIEYKISTYEPLKDVIKDVYKKEFRKLDRVEYSKSKKLERIKLKYNMDISILRYRHYKTRSKTVKEFCENEIARLTEELNKKEKEIKEIQTSKKQIVKAMASVLSIHNEKGNLVQ